MEEQTTSADRQPSTDERAQLDAVMRKIGIWGVVFPNPRSRLSKPTS